MAYSTGVNLNVRAVTLRAKFPKEKILADILDAQSEAIEDVEKLVWEFLKKNFSQRHYTLRQLESMGHPYAVASRKKLPQPDWVINSQSGRFYRGFAVSIGSNVSSGGKNFAKLVVENYDSKARVLQDGNGRMRPRPWREAIKREFMDNFYARLGTELRKRLRLRFYNPRASSSIART